MAPRRWLLLALSLASLVVLSYAAIALAFSVPMTAETMQANRGAQDVPDPGHRIVVAPLADPADVARGDRLVVAERPAAIPAQSEGPILVEALVFVPAPPNGTYGDDATLVLENLTQTGAEGNGTFNATVDLAALAGGRAGFLVKGAAERDVRFVEAGQVVGRAARFESAAWMFGLTAAGAVAFVAPLVALVLTHRPTGRPGLPGGVPGPACPECRRATPPGSDFCTGCGAWLRDQG